MSTPVEQIKEKLKRANEHLMQLEGELETFQNEAPYGPISNYNAEQAKAFRDLWEKRAIPPRFPVIAGEVLQQLRSSLTYLHVALIVRDGNVPDTRSQFPIFSTKPTEPKDIARYETQVRGITRRKVLAAIKRHQPYTRRTRFDGKKWLSLLGGMSNIDKHEAVVLCIAVVGPRIRSTSSVPGVGGWEIESGHREHGAERAVPLPLGGECVEVMDVERTFIAYVAFPKFGRASYPQPVCTVLRQFTAGVRGIIGELEPFLA